MTPIGTVALVFYIWGVAFFLAAWVAPDHKRGGRLEDLAAMVLLVVWPLVICWIMLARVDQEADED